MTFAGLREAALFVTSPDGHTDDDRLQAAFALLRTKAPVYWVEPPGVRPVTARVRYGANKSTLGRGRQRASPWLSHNPARLRPLGRQALEPSQSLCFRSLIITRNLIPRNRGAACPLGSAV